MLNVNCNLCGSRDHKAIIYSKDYTFPGTEKFQVVKCLTCGLVFINPRPTDDEMGRYYPDKYYDRYEELKDESEAIQNKKIKIVERIKKSGRILDAGCGKGYFLHNIQNKGWDVSGIEISAGAAGYARDILGIKNIYQQDILKVSLTADYFDVITLWNVIEHLSNPLQALKKAHALLKDDGVLIINCPNFNSILRVAFGDKWYQLDAPRHLYHFTPETLRQMLKISGFKIKKIDYAPFPLYATIWMKLGIFRWLGLKNFLYNAEQKEQNTSNIARRKTFTWILARNSFNLFCGILAVSLSFLRLGDDMCVVAGKKN